MITGFNKMLAVFRYDAQLPDAERAALSDSVSEQVRTLEADNAALVAACSDLREVAFEGPSVVKGAPGGETVYDWKQRIDRETRAVSTAPHPGAAMLAEMEALRAKTSVSMGVGDGSGSLFVYGDYASIKAAQAIVLERDNLRARVAELEAERDEATDRARDAMSDADRMRKQRDDARAKAATARDEVLEEAREAARRFQDGGRAALKPSAPTDMRAALEAGCRVLDELRLHLDALKFEPGKRFVDAEEVRQVLDIADQGLRNAINYGLSLEHHQEAVAAMLERLGLTLDGETS